MALETMNFYIVVPQAAENLIGNPTPYRNTTGYTAYSPGAGAAIDLSYTHSRRGPRSLRMTTVANYYTRVNSYLASDLTGGETYVFSVDVLATEGLTMEIGGMLNGAPYTSIGSKYFSATGRWQRVSVVLTPGATASYFVYVVRDVTSNTDYVYTDGWQVEKNTEATTFFSGDSKGFGIGVPEFYWKGEPHNSISVRTVDTRAGGRLLNIKDYAAINASVGLGLGEFSQVYSELVGGGAYYQRSIRKPRIFSLALTYYGTSPDDLHTNRNAIIEAVTPDLTGYDQPMIIRYQGLDADDNEATEPIDIACIMQPSHKDLPDNRYWQKDTLNFTVLDSYLAGAYKEGIQMSHYDTFSNPNMVMYRDENGLWHEIASMPTSLAVYTLCELNGEIYIGGSFVNAGGIAEADYLCKWTGTAIDDVTGAADFGGNVWALLADPNGDLLICGTFDDAGGIPAADGIVKWNGSSLSAIDGGVTSAGTVYAVAIDPATGDIYIGGSFTQVDSKSGTTYIASYVQSSSDWFAVSGGLNGEVRALAFGPDGKLYIGGSFTSADGTDGDYICSFDPTNAPAGFVRLGTVELNGAVKALAFDDQGRLYAGGSFTNAGGDANADYIAVWKGNAWQSLGGGVDDEIWKISVVGDEIIVTGNLTEAGGISMPNRTAVWRNGSWHPLDIFLPGSGRVYSAVKTKDGKLWIAGTFSSNSGTAYASEIELARNNGNAEVYPIFEYIGPGTIQSIRNASTGAEITISGLTLLAGEVVTLDLNPVDVKMWSSWEGRGNLLRHVNPGSDLGGFYLKPGENYLTQFLVSDTAGGTRVFVMWTPKFWNIEGARLE